MSILSVTEEGKSRSAASNLTTLSATRIYLVEFSSDSDPIKAPIQAHDASGIPRRYDEHPASPWLYVSGKSVATISLFLYQITVNYTSIDNPLNIRPEIEWSNATTNEPIDQGVDGKPLLTSADEPLDPPVVAEFPDLILRVGRNTNNYNPLDAQNYKNRSVNNDNFLVFSPGMARLTKWGAKVQRAAGLSYFAETLEIRFRADGWNRRRLDRGLREKTGSDPATYENITDDNDQPITQPVLLDGSGAKLAAGAAPVYVNYEIMRPLSYSALNISLT